jgi:hypothetical protein
LPSVLAFTGLLLPSFAMVFVVEWVDNCNFVGGGRV